MPQFPNWDTPESAQLRLNPHVAKTHSNRVLTLLLFVCLPSAATALFGQEAFPRHAPWETSVAWSRSIHEGGATIQLDIAPGPLDLGRGQITEWVETAARAVSEYYGRFPVRRARVLVIPVADRRGVLTGATWGGVDGFPAFVRMRLGDHSTEQDLTDDWTMTHEFVHTALPTLSPDHHWLEEGIATYVEPIARAQIGTLSPAYVWKETMDGMPKGESRAGAKGLDQTHTWANTYWGGALFCMMADIEIREKTGNRKGLEDGLRGILPAGGSIAVDWSISKVIAVADRATGTSVLADLYRQMGNQSFAPIDLNELWSRLGIRMLNGEVEFNSQAPLARIREAITTPEPVRDKAATTEQHEQLGQTRKRWRAPPAR